MSDWLTSSDLFDQYTPFPDLDILGPDFCPDYDIHDDSNLIGNHCQLSPDTPPCSNVLEVDLQDELDKILKAEGSDPFFKTDYDVYNQDINNNNDDLTVKEETESFDHLLEDHWQSLSSNLISGQLSHNQGDLATKLKEEEEEILPAVKDEDYQFNLNIPRPTLSYVRHIQPMPERTSPLPQLKSRKRTFSFSQSSLLNPQNPSSAAALKEKEVTYLGRTIVPWPLTHKLLQTPRGQQGLMRLNSPQVKAHSQIPTLSSVNAQSQSSVSYDNPVNVVVLVRKYRDRTSNVRKGVSILKPISSNLVKNAAGANITDAKAKQSHNNTQWKSTSLTIRRALASKNSVTWAQQKKPGMRETSKKRILGKFIRWPRVESPGHRQITSSSGWVTKEDPLKEKKNQLERDRRGELAMYRDNLRKMLPETKEGEKVATVTVLERTREYCLLLQQQEDQLQFDMEAVQEKNCLLRRRLARLTVCQASVKNSLKEGKITLENFFENFDI